MQQRTPIFACRASFITEDLSHFSIKARTAAAAVAWATMRRLRVFPG
jgi:hypothetical protein